VKGEEMSSIDVIVIVYPERENVQTFANDKVMERRL
jgi:hypothetical protein